MANVESYYQDTLTKYVRHLFHATSCKYALLNQDQYTITILRDTMLNITGPYVKNFLYPSKVKFDFLVNFFRSPYNFESNVCRLYTTNMFCIILILPTYFIYGYLYIMKRSSCCIDSLHSDTKENVIQFTCVYIFRNCM